MIIAQLSIAPLGDGTSVSRYVKIVLETLKSEHVHYETNAMATVIEIDCVEHLFKIVEKTHNAVAKAGAMRIITELKIDDRRDKQVTIQSKLASLQK